MPLVIAEERLSSILAKLSSFEESANGMSVISRRISEMASYYEHFNETDEDSVVYEVLSWPEDGRDTALLITITVLYPGTVGKEHFHTKGHFHFEPDGPEFVVGYKGHGLLEMGDRQGFLTTAAVHPGTHVWVPPGTAHRMMNTSSEPVTYLSISSAAVGHDYESVAVLGWKYNH